MIRTESKLKEHAGTWIDSINLSLFVLPSFKNGEVQTKTHLEYPSWNPLDRRKIWWLTNDEGFTFSHLTGKWNSIKVFIHVVCDLKFKPSPPLEINLKMISSKHFLLLKSEVCTFICLLSTNQQIKFIHSVMWLHLDVYFGVPNWRTCAFIYFWTENHTCVGLLGTVHLLILALKYLVKEIH